MSKRYIMDILNRIILFTVFLVIAIDANSQEVVHLRNGDVVKVVITNETRTKVHYFIYGEADGPKYNIQKDNIIKIVYENGEEVFFYDNNNAQVEVGLERRQAIKKGLFAPLFGYSYFTYERAIDRKSSFEVKMSLIGLGVNYDMENDVFTPTGRLSFKRNGSGVALSGSYKFRGIGKSKELMEAMQSHILRGWYSATELTLGTYSENYAIDFDSQKPIRRRVYSGAVALNFGKQNIYNNAFLLDIYVGLAYLFTNTSEEGQGDFLFLSDNGGFVPSAGLRIGFLL